jgi:hypothetical protein
LDLKKERKKIENLEVDGTLQMIVEKEVREKLVEEVMENKKKGLRTP